MKADAIFEGGGVRGIAFIGAVTCMEDKGYEFQRLAGTSAGAIMAALLAAGYTGKELSMLEGRQFTQFLDKDAIQKLPLIGAPMSLIMEKGLYRGNFVEKQINELLAAKGKTKFKDVMFEGKSRLKIIASDITRRQILILPDDLPRYGIDPMEFEIAKAVRMSISIPLFFTPVILKYREEVKQNHEAGKPSTPLKRTSKACVSYIVDGGVLSNFPVWIFDRTGTPRWPTFGFRLVDSVQSSCTPEKTDVLTYMIDIFEAMLHVDQTAFMRDKDSVRTISIPTSGVRATDFDISPMEAFCLYQSGYESTASFLKQWNFRSYLGKFR